MHLAQMVVYLQTFEMLSFITSPFHLHCWFQVTVVDAGTVLSWLRIANGQAPPVTISGGAQKVSSLSVEQVWPLFVMPDIKDSQLKSQLCVSG